MNSIDRWLKAIAVILIISFIGEVVLGYGIIGFFKTFNLLLSWVLIVALNNFELKLTFKN